jgi:hypothetical protein
VTTVYSSFFQGPVSDERHNVSDDREQTVLSQPLTSSESSPHPALRSDSRLGNGLGDGLRSGVLLPRTCIFLSFI